MKKLLFLVVLLLLTRVSSGQILNVERFRLEKDTARIWLGNAGLGFSVKKQQNSIYTLNGNLNAVYLSDLHSYMSLNYFKFLRQESTNLLSEGYAHGRVNWFRKKTLSFETFLQYQYDIGRGLEWREIYGATLRLSVFSNDEGYFAINSGAMYENERWEGDVLRFGINGSDTEAETRFIKSTTNATFKANLTPSIYLFVVAYYQARFDAFFHPRVITDVQFQFKVNKYLSFNTQFTSTYDALPIVDGNSFVYTFNNTLVINFNP